MRLRITEADAVFYPDVLVHCDPTPNPAATTELTSARLVLEVLSPTTQHFDRGAKLLAYQKLKGLRHIVLLSGMEPAAWACHCSEEGTWSELQPWPRDTTLALPGLGVEVGWDEVYGGVGLS
jgi:Uma2 family endonuclease